MGLEIRKLSTPPFFPVPEERFTSNCGKAVLQLLSAAQSSSFKQSSYFIFFLGGVTILFHSSCFTITWEQTQNFNLPCVKIGDNSSGYCLKLVTELRTAEGVLWMPWGQKSNPDQVLTMEPELHMVPDLTVASPTQLSASGQDVKLFDVHFLSPSWNSGPFLVPPGGLWK